MQDTKPRGCIDMDMFTHVQHVTRREDDEEDDEDDGSSRRAIIEISTGKSGRLSGMAMHVGLPEACGMSR